MESADSRQRIAAGAWGQRHGRPAPSFWCRVLSSPPPVGFSYCDAGGPGGAGTFDPMTILDLVAIAPLYITSILEFIHNSGGSDIGGIFKVVRIIRLVRVLRIL